MRQALLHLLMSAALMLLAATGCEPGKSQPASPASREVHAEDKGDYELGVRLIDFAGNYTLLINGFPVSRLPVMGRTAGQTVGASVQTGLIGEGNTASVQVKPYLARSEDALKVGPIEFEAWVQRDTGDERLPDVEITAGQVDSAYAAWTRRAEEQWQGYLRWEEVWLEAHPDSAATLSWRRGGALDSLRVWAARHPLTVSATFDNETGPDFSALFEEAPVIEGTPQDTSRLIDYAMRLRDLFQRRDATAIYRTQQPKFAAIYFSEDQALSAIRGNWFSYDWWFDFERQDVELRKWSGGRVWELYRRDRKAMQTGKRALLLAGKGGRLATWHEVYVAEIGGELKVVR